MDFPLWKLLSQLCKPLSEVNLSYGDIFMINAGTQQLADVIGWAFGLSQLFSMTGQDVFLLAMQGYVLCM